MQKNWCLCSFITSSCVLKHLFICYVLWLQKNIILCYIKIFSFQLVIRTKSGELVDRLSPWAKFVTQPDDTKAYDQVFWSPPQVERWEGGHLEKKIPKIIKIYVTTYMDYAYKIYKFNIVLSLCTIFFLNLLFFVNDRNTNFNILVPRDKMTYEFMSRMWALHHGKGKLPHIRSLPKMLYPESRI